MKPARLFTLMLLFTVLPVSACVTTSTTSTTWPAQAEWSRPGYVEWVREVVRREEGNPAGGALAGALIGGLLGGDGPSAVIGAIGGAAIGAAASQGGAESRTYEIMVRFDDGGQQLFAYPDHAPFRPGQPVVMDPRGLYGR